MRWAAPSPDTITMACKFPRLKWFHFFCKSWGLLWPSPSHAWAFSQPLRAGRFFPNVTCNITDPTKRTTNDPHVQLQIRKPGLLIFTCCNCPEKVDSWLFISFKWLGVAWAFPQQCLRPLRAVCFSFPNVTSLTQQERTTSALTCTVENQETWFTDFHLLHLSWKSGFLMIYLIYEI